VSGDGDQVLLVVHEGDDRVEIVPGFGEWRTHGPVVASAAWGVDGESGAGGVGVLRVEVIFVETPHRMHLVVDPAAGTFDAWWETTPLRTSRLAEVRRPSEVVDGSGSSVW
jgi:hypothetical protein